MVKKHWSSEQDVHGSFMVSNSEKLDFGPPTGVKKCQAKRNRVNCLLCLPRCLSGELNARYPFHHLCIIFQLFYPP